MYKFKQNEALAMLVTRPLQAFGNISILITTETDNKKVRPNLLLRSGVISIVKRCCPLSDSSKRTGGFSELIISAGTRQEHNDKQ